MNPTTAALVASILDMHHVPADERALVTSACLSCHSITMAPDAVTKRIMQAHYDMTCCTEALTILP